MMHHLRVIADSKYHSDAPFTCVDVVFDKREQIEALIAALTKLLASNEEVDQVELADDDTTGDRGLGANIYFHAPGFKRDALDRDCLAAAEHLIMRYHNESHGNDG